jgi:hypothetical protein
MNRPTFALLVLLPAAASLAGARRHADVRAEWAAAEVARLRAHFDSVDAELRARDVSALSPAQRAARARHVALLRAYRDRGVFPRNTDFPGRRVAYFVDRDGVACAVGALLLADGRGDIVDRVRRVDNHVLVPALAGDTALRAWLDGVGLTLAEAARIQPTYGGVREDDVDLVTAVLSGVAGALGGVTVGVNFAARPEARGRGWRIGAGVASGVVNFLLAAAMLDVDDDPGSHTLAAVNGVVGAASLTSALWVADHRPAAVSPTPGGDGAEHASRAAELTLAPGLAPSPDGRVRPAVVGRIRF